MKTYRVIAVTETRWIRRTFGQDKYLEHLDGVAWNAAPLPSRWHTCTAQTRGFIGLDYIERCACGAARLGPHRNWIHKNETRNSRKRRRAG